MYAAMTNRPISNYPIANHHIAIRPAEPDDATALAAMANDLLAGLSLPTAPVTPAMMARAITSDRAGLTILVAESPTLSASPNTTGTTNTAAHGLIGYSLFQDSYDTDFGGWTVWMHDLYMADSARNKGLGRMLLDAVMAEAVKRGAVALTWAMAKENIDAARFYRRIDGVQPLDYALWTMPLRS